ncbi:MAG: replicative DNA helicase [Candidatus Abawacabacteria bacterium RIFCSPHIGHO2_01_FULL_46_8]|uniref:Replicative DNA helicase n=1 Tax=Candidatus Abawacabacteria bacterium RIFCSPHIGHO2_01_FULL_46_8 TaxID=1817815 RepID=A0A1F4XM29_9BACT|nr:MAG: replicative DNA helicase [Candidatus Abawacabacteria bacterium RIFCSPHIGHO2_01_FULL_46_8]
MANKIINKIPPQNVEAEQSVLGSLLLDKNAIFKVVDFLEPEDFYEQRHEMIYAAMMSLFQRHSPIDILTLASILKERKQLKEVGGKAYLGELASIVPTASHVEQYANLVKGKSTLRRLISAADRIMALGYEEEEELALKLEKAEQSLFAVSQSFMRENFVPIEKLLNDSYQRIADLHDARAKAKKEGKKFEVYRGMKTGFYDLDRLLSGLQPSELIILAARPSMGKTALALNIIQQIALDTGKPVGIFSLEMSKEQLVERLFCSLLRVDSWKLRTGNLSRDEMARFGNAMDKLHQAPIYIDDSADANVIEIRAKARRLKMEKGLELLVVDYLQLMSGSSPDNRVQEISEISRSLKGLARELNIPIIALSQLNRAVENRPGKIPQLSDLRESGAIEQDADVVLMMYREDYYKEDCERKGITDIYIRKHRNGPVGKIELGFNMDQMRFINLEQQRVAQPAQAESVRDKRVAAAF